MTDIEYEEALEDRANQLAMWQACGRFKDRLSLDVLENCRLHGLYKCIDTHREGMGNKFTSSLFQHVTWQCLEALRGDEQGSVGVERQGRENLRPLVDEFLSLLSDRDSSFIQDRFLLNYTFDELANKYKCTKAGAKYIVDKALEKMKNGV